MIGWFIFQGKVNCGFVTDSLFTFLWFYLASDRWLSNWLSYFFLWLKLYRSDSLIYRFGLSLHFVLSLQSAICTQSSLHSVLTDLGGLSEGPITFRARKAVLCANVYIKDSKFVGFERWVTKLIKQIGLIWGLKTTPTFHRFWS